MNEFAGFPRSERSEYSSYPGPEDKGKEEVQKPRPHEDSLAEKTPPMKSGLWRKTSREDSGDPKENYANGDDRAERVKGERQLPVAVDESVQSARHPAPRARKSRELPKWAEHNRSKPGRRETDEEEDEHNQEDSRERLVTFSRDVPLAGSSGMGSPHAPPFRLHVHVPSPARCQRRFSSLCMSTRLITPRLKTPKMREIIGRWLSDRPARRFRSAMSTGYL